VPPESDAANLDLALVGVPHSSGAQNATRIGFALVCLTADRDAPGG